MTLQTNHIRREGKTDAHVWPEEAEKGDPALCGTEWTGGFGTLVPLPQAGLGDDLVEVLTGDEVCTMCRTEAINYLNLPRRTKTEAMSVPELAEAYLEAVDEEEGG